jgi:hypothetical protein
VEDYPNSYPTLAKALDVDVFTANSGYRYLDPSAFFEGEAGSPGWIKLSQQYNKPILIGEVGMHWNPNITAQVPDWPNQLYYQFGRRITTGCVGLFYYVYSDSIRKSEDQRYMGFVSFQENVVNGKSSLSPNSNVADKAVRKPILFQGLKSGHPGSKYAQWNFANNNIWALTKSTQLTMDLPAECPPDPELTEPPRPDDKYREYPDPSPTLSGLIPVASSSMMPPISSSDPGAGGSNGGGSGSNSASSTMSAFGDVRLVSIAVAVVMLSSLLPMIVSALRSR